jgi:hypothetical protein
MAIVISPLGRRQKLLNGFSKKIFKDIKNARVTRDTTMTQGRNS